MDGLNESPMSPDPQADSSLEGTGQTAPNAQRETAAPAPTPATEPEGFKFNDSPFLDPPPVDYDAFKTPEAAPAEEPPAPPDYSQHVDKLPGQAAATADSEVKAMMEGYKAQLDALPEVPDIVPSEQWLEMTPEQQQAYNKILRTKERITAMMEEVVPAFGGLKRQVNGVQANQVMDVRKRVMHEFPDVAERVAEMADLTPIDLQNEAGYQRLVQQAMGERAYQTSVKDKFSGASQMAGGSHRSGGGQEATQQISLPELELLQRMGVRGNYLSRAANNLKGGN